MARNLFQLRTKHVPLNYCYLQECFYLESNLWKVRFWQQIQLYIYYLYHLRIQLNHILYQFFIYVIYHFKNVTIIIRGINSVSLHINIPTQRLSKTVKWHSEIFIFTSSNKKSPALLWVTYTESCIIHFSINFILNIHGVTSCTQLPT